MTTVKRTPDEALKAVQTLWPHVQSIRKPSSGTYAVWDCGGTSEIEVEWPKGITEWPRGCKELEGTRPAKLPEDLWKAAVFRETVNGPVFTGQLVGRVPSPSEVQDGWICLVPSGAMARYRFCYVKEDVTATASESDPGEGYRLIDKEHDVPGDHDEYWSHCDQRWKPRGRNVRSAFMSCYPYRRPIVTYKHGITASTGHRLLDQGEPVTNKTQVWCPTLEGWFYLTNLNNHQMAGFVYQTPIK